MRRKPNKKFPKGGSRCRKGAGLHGQFGVSFLPDLHAGLTIETMCSSTPAGENKTGIRGQEWEQNETKNEQRKMENGKRNERLWTQTSKSAVR